MDLINKENGSPAIHPQRILRPGDHRFHIFLARNRRIDLLKLSLRGIGDHFGQGRLAGTRRSVKDHGSQLVGHDRTIEHLISANDMLLTDNLLECRRTEP